MKTIQILVGIPCSGKSTYASIINNTFHLNTYIISRDKTREAFFGKRYKQNNKQEIFISKQNTKALVFYLMRGDNVILDNTHCKEKYIDEIINKYGKDNKIEIKFFDIPLWKAHYRNIIRYFKTGKWIPIKIMNNMYKNYKQINRKKYAKYECK